jgi:hypothetical protein
MTTTTITAAATPAARQRLSREPDSSKLQAQKYFTITDLTGSKAIEIGTTLTWREGQLLRPAADSASGPSDWKLVKVEAKAPVVSNKKSDSSSVASWVTTCGYLQWLKSSREVKYTAEVDGCSVSADVALCNAVLCAESFVDCAPSVVWHCSPAAYYCCAGRVMSQKA